MDTVAARAIIEAELRRRVRFSGGPEVFRHLLVGHEELADAAVRELVREGVLKETPLRVGTIYHYPANMKASLEYLSEQLARMAEAPVRAPRPERPAPVADARPAATHAVPPVEAQGAVSAPTDSSPAAPATGFTGPIRAQKKSAVTGAVAAPGSPATPAPAPTFTGPIRAKKKSELAAEAAVGSPDAAGGSEGAAPAVTEPTAAPTVFTGPIKARKKSEIAAEAEAAAAAGPKSDTAPPAAASRAPVSPPAESPAGPPVYTGPIKAKKKSELAAEAAAEAASAGSTDPGPPQATAPEADPSPVVAPTDATERPVTYTGPIKARKKSQIAAEERGESTDG